MTLNNENYKLETQFNITINNVNKRIIEISILLHLSHSSFAFHTDHLISYIFIVCIVCIDEL